jgi:hypothetical protein
MADPTDDRIKAIRTKRPDALYSGIGWADQMVDDMRALAAEVARRRAAQIASAERVRAVVREACAKLCRCEEQAVIDAIADRVAAQLTTFEDGGASERAVRVTQPRAGDRLLLIVREGAPEPGSGWSPVGIVQGFSLHGMTVTQADLDANHGIAPYDIPVREIHLDGGDITELGRRAAAAVKEVFAGGAVFEDGGEPRKRQALGPHATQQGAATPGQGATAQGAAQAAGNVAEPQLGPTPDRAERPPSSPSLGEEYACDCAKNRCPVAADLQRGPCTGTCGCRGCARGYSDFLDFE